MTPAIFRLCVSGNGGYGFASLTWTRLSPPALLAAGMLSRCPAEEVDEGSVTEWATFGAAMAEATAALERADRSDLVRALDRLTEAARALGDALRKSSTG